MIKSFDLAKYEDVKQWSAKIAHSLSAKTMPADASQPWPDEWMVGGRRLQPVANAPGVPCDSGGVRARSATVTGLPGYAA